jgi:hypothetical protein
MICLRPYIARYPTKGQEYTQENLKLTDRIRPEQYPGPTLTISRFPQGPPSHVNLLLQIP